MVLSRFVSDANRATQLPYRLSVSAGVEHTRMAAAQQHTVNVEVQ